MNDKDNDLFNTAIAKPKPLELTSFTDSDKKVMDIRQILALKLFQIMMSIDKKIINGKIRDKEAEKIRLEYIKSFVNACNCFNNLCKNDGVGSDFEIDVLKKFVGNDYELPDIIVENSE
ncbi:hypothetical protein IKD56_00050 [bacterium]|nr:hypothetical protein [bacterium]